MFGHQLLVMLALCDCGSSLRLFAQPRCSRPRLSLAATPEKFSDVKLSEQRRLYDKRKSHAEAAGTPQSSWSTKPTRAVLDGLFRAGWQPRLEPEPLPVIELDGSLEPEALARYNLSRSPLPDLPSTRSAPALHPLGTRSAGCCATTAAPWWCAASSRPRRAARWPRCCAVTTARWPGAIGT